MNPSIFTANANLNITRYRNFEGSSDLRYFFLVRKSESEDNICFSVVLKSSGNSIINSVWFSTFVGIGGTKFGPGLDDQDSFYVKTFLGQYMSGYTRERFKLPPETILEILYFDIPKDKLLNEGSLEFYYGCESLKKISFIAQWNKGEIKSKAKEINTQTFINFLKYKNHKTCFEKIGLFLKKFYNKKIKKQKNY